VVEARAGRRGGMGEGKRTNNQQAGRRAGRQAAHPDECLEAAGGHKQAVLHHGTGKVRERSSAGRRLQAPPVIRGVPQPAQQRQRVALHAVLVEVLRCRKDGGEVRP